MPSTSPSPSPPLSAAERRWAQVDRLVAGLALVAVALVMAGTAEPGPRPDAKHAMHTSFPRPPMDTDHLRTLLAAWPAAEAGDDPVLRVTCYGGEDPDAGHLAGNRAGLVHFARACLEAALTPNQDVGIVGPPARGPRAAAAGTASLFDAGSDLCLVGVTCEEPLTRIADTTGAAPGRLDRLAGPLAGLALLGCLALLVIGGLTVVGWLLA